MKTIKLSLLVFGAMIFALNVNAQTKTRTGNWCYTDQHSEEMKQQNPELIQKELDFLENVRQYMVNNPPSNNNPEASPYIIPMVFHCITDNGQGYCSKSDIEDQLLTINEDFQRLNGDAVNTRALFVPYAMAMNIEFRLAHLDPNGNCTEGIVRLDDPLSTSCVPRDLIKSVSYWDSKKYFNVWVVNSIDPGASPGIILGYAQFPWTGINTTYGVVVDNDYVSRTDRTLTHEIGHCFGLLHTFQSGCGSNCANSGDNVCDTPPAATDTYGCSSVQNSCSNDATGPSVYSSNVVDQIENFMSYDQCQNMFSLGQKTFMEATLNSVSVSTGLDQLNTPANHALTGVGNPYNPPICAPTAEFSYDKEFICEGASVSFSDLSYNGTPTAWNWTFTGGTPNSSPAQNPTITYNTAGVYGVTHQPSNATGAGNITKNSIITVSTLAAAHAGPFIDGFEVAATFNNEWWIENPSGGQLWQWNNQSAYTGGGSSRVLNVFTNFVGRVDAMISPSYDISTATIKTMTFKQAFAKRSAGNTDKLLIYQSTDCGNTWLLKLPLTASVLATAPNQTASFIPTNQSEWTTRTVDLSSIATATNVRFKFEFTSGLGNNIYIDDINIGGAVGIEDYSVIGSFNIYPNPTNSSAEVSFYLNDNVQNLSIKVKNAVGQDVTHIINGQSFNQGKYTLKIDEQHKLSSGIYFIEFNADNNIKVEKLIVQYQIVVNK